MSIKWRLAIIVGMITVFLVVLSGIVLQWRIAAGINATTEDALRSTGRRVANDLSSGRLVLYTGRLVRVAGDSELVQVATDSGRLLYTTEAAGKSLLLAKRSLLTVRPGVFISTRTSAGLRRLIFVRTSSGPSGGFIIVASTEDELSNALSQLWLVVAFGGPIVVVLSVIGAWILAQIALRPVARLSLEAETLSVGRLSQRLEVPTTNDELATLAEMLNRLLDRLQALMETQHWFIQSASHELRTPLATISAELQLASLHASDPVALGDALQAAEIAVDQLAALSDDLLLLAQGQAGSLALTLQKVDLEWLAAGALAAASDRSMDASLSFVLDCPVALSVVADPIRVRQILDNLLENCLRYASRGMVTLSVGREGEWVVVAIQDEGEGFPDELLDSAFERFRLGVPSRSRETGGAGLGLSIVSLLTELHHGSVRLENVVSGGARVSVLLPLAGEIKANQRP